MNSRNVARWIISIMYCFAGVMHLVQPAPFLSIMPVWVPMPETVVFWTGVTELIGAAALLQDVVPRLTRAGAWWLAAYALCVFPANINHFLLDMTREDGGLGLAYHLPRMAAQPMLIAVTLWAGNAWGRRNDSPAPQLP